VVPLTIKLAVTLFAVFITSVQVVEVPMQSPLQPENANPLAGAAVRVTWVPVKIDTAHVPELPVAHDIPASLELTAPLPEPVAATDNM
jgi:hypothetical protein